MSPACSSVKSQNAMKISQPLVLPCEIYSMITSLIISILIFEYCRSFIHCCLHLEKLKYTSYARPAQLKENN